MAEIGVGFKLFADVNSLERGVVKMHTGVKNLNAEIGLIGKVFGTVGKVIAATGITQAFSAAIASAQALRDEARQNGLQIDSATDAVARYGDMWDSIRGRVSSFGRDVLGGIVKFGEAVGETLRSVFTEGKNATDLAGAYERLNTLRQSEINLAETLKRIDEARVKYNASLDDSLARQKKSREELLKLTKEAGDLERKNWMENLSSAEKMRFYIQLLDTSKQLGADPNASEAQRAGARVSAQNAQSEINRLTRENIDAQNEVTELRKQERREQRELTKDRGRAVDQVASDQAALTDRSKLTLSELASKSSFSVGVSTDLGAAGARAREALDLEKQAEGRRMAGDVAGAEELRGRAGGIRQSLVSQGVLKSGEGDPSIPLKKALKESEDALKSIDNKLAGVAE